MGLSPYPENRRRRLKRARHRLALDRSFFLERYPSHAEAEKLYDQQRARLDREIHETYSSVYRRRLHTAAARTGSPA